MDPGDFLDQQEERYNQNYINSIEDVNFSIKY